MRESPIRIAVVDDHEVVRHGLSAFLGARPEFDVVAAVPSPRGIDAHAAIDVVLMDVSIPGQDGIAATQELLSRGAAPRVLILSSHEDVATLRRALAAGASGYVAKSAGAEHIAEAITTIAAGRSYIDPQLAGMLLTAAPDEGEILTRREREIVDLVAHGASNREIAETLFISERTARTHVSNVLGKLNLTSRTQLALWAREHSG